MHMLSEYRWLWIINFTLVWMSRQKSRVFNQKRPILRECLASFTWWLWMNASRENDLSKEPYFESKEPYFESEEPYFYEKRPILSNDSTLVRMTRQKSPVFYQKRPILQEWLVTFTWRLNRWLWVDDSRVNNSSKEPCIPWKETYITRMPPQPQPIHMWLSKEFSVRAENWVFGQKNRFLVYVYVRVLTCICLYSCIDLHMFIFVYWLVYTYIYIYILWQYRDPGAHHLRLKEMGYHPPST